MQTRMMTAVAAGALALGGVAALAPTTAQASAKDTVRLAGPNRYSTAVAVSKYVSQYQPSSDHGYFTVVAGTNFPDGLTAGASRAWAGNHLLLKPQGDTLPQDVARELTSVERPHITLVGDRLIMSDRFRESIRAMDNSYDWRFGVDRYATAYDLELSNLDGFDDAIYIASGENFPDALAAAPVAGMTDKPIYLTRKNSLYPALVKGTPNAVSSARSIYVLGASASVSDAVVSQVRKAAPSARVERLQGHNRYETAAAISRHGFPDGANRVFLVSGKSYADALPAGAAGGILKAPVLLSDTNCVPRATLAEIKRLGATRFVVVGGPTTLTDKVVNRVPCRY